MRKMNAGSTRKIKVSDKKAVEMLGVAGTVIQRGLEKQSAEWLSLYWQTLSDAQKTRVAEVYLQKTAA